VEGTEREEKRERRDTRTRRSAAAATAEGSGVEWMELIAVNERHTTRVNEQK